MKHDEKQTKLSRRTFLRGTLATGAGAAMVAAVPAVAAADTSEASIDSDAQPKGYRLTQHILDYYKTAAS
ncbi:MAG: hypothetical protein R3354_07330 [Thiohalomonadales bacterium]|nr:hypothetical protein [Thiohalomonadales bacterium]